MLIPDARVLVYYIQIIQPLFLLEWDYAPSKCLITVVQSYLLNKLSRTPVHITLTLDTNNFATLRRLKFLIVCKTLLSNRCLSHYEWHILVMEPWPNWYFSVISIEPEYLIIDLHVCLVLELNYICLN